MPEFANKLGSLTNRISNRLIWKFASRPRTVRTTMPLVSFTFDDVPESAFTQGAGILEKYGVFGTFYIAGGITGLIEEDRTLISSQSCADLAQRGHEVGCHTFSHCAIRTMSSGTLSTLR